MSLMQPSRSDKLLHILCSPHIRTAVLRYAGTHRVRLHCVHSYTPFGFSLVSRAIEIRSGKARRVGSIQRSPLELGIPHYSISCAGNRLMKSGIDCSLLPVSYTVCLCPPQEVLMLISLLPAAIALVRSRFTCQERKRLEVFCHEYYFPIPFVPSLATVCCFPLRGLLWKTTPGGLARHPHVVSRAANPSPKFL